MDLAFQDTSQVIWYPRLSRWVPLIMGGADDAASTTGDASSGDAGGRTETVADSDAGTGQAARTFTQDEVNALITREVDKAKRGKLEPSELGFASKKELEEFLTDAKAKAEAAKTEAEKALDDARKEAAEAAKAEVLPKAHEALRKAQFLVGASAAGIPADRLEKAYLLAKALDGWGEVKVEDDAVVGLNEDFFKALKEDSPFLFLDNKGGSGGDIGAGAGGQGSPAAREQTLRERYGALSR